MRMSRQSGSLIWPAESVKPLSIKICHHSHPLLTTNASEPGDWWGEGNDYRDEQNEDREHQYNCDCNIVLESRINGCVGYVYRTNK